MWSKDLPITLQDTDHGSRRDPGVFFNTKLKNTGISPQEFTTRRPTTVSLGNNAVTDISKDRIELLNVIGDPFCDDKKGKHD